MRITFNAPVLFVKDIEVSLKFYTEILDQEIEHNFGNNIMFKSRLSLWQLKEEYEVTSVAGNNQNGNATEFYFETDDIENSFRKLSQAGVRFLHPVKTEPWGQKTFRFFDPDDHLIEIGEEFNTFIIRIFGETGSTSETAKRTGVPEKMVSNIVSQAN